MEQILGIHTLAEFYFKDVKGYIIYHLCQDDLCINSFTFKDEEHFRRNFKYGINYLEPINVDSYGDYLINEEENISNDINLYLIKDGKKNILMKRRIIIYKEGDYFLMAEDQSFRRRYIFFGKKKWWNVSGAYGIGSIIETGKEYILMKNWILERVQEYKEKNIEIEIVNETNYDIFK